MFRRERSIPLRGSAAALSNNLSVLQLPARDLTHFGVVHGPSAQILSAAPEGVPLAQRQLQVKVGVGVSPPLITQVRLGVKEALLKSALPLFFKPYALDDSCSLSAGMPMCVSPGPLVCPSLQSTAGSHLTSKDTGKKRAFPPLSSRLPSPVPYE